MLRAAYAILRNQHDAEDAVSAAVVKVAARIADGHAVDDPSAYLIQSTRNAALDELRASARRRGNQAGHRSDGTPSLTAAHSAQPGDIADASPDIVEQVIERQRTADLRTAVRRTLDGLPEREATMLALLLTGRTRAEIGGKFNLTGQRVGQLLKVPIIDLLSQLEISPPGQPRRRRSGG